jgi:ABC-type Zn2+ transport system substrate-binding protein/surface adhesin
MKKQMIRMITLLAFSSVLLSSCAVGYRQNRNRTHDDRRNSRGHDRDHDNNHDHNDHNNYYKRY